MVIEFLSRTALVDVEQIPSQSFIYETRTTTVHVQLPSICGEQNSWDFRRAFISATGNILDPLIRLVDAQQPTRFSLVCARKQ
jgi:hypothetical protein